MVFSGIRLLSDTIMESEFKVCATFGALAQEPSAEHPAALALNRPGLMSKSELIYAIVEGLIANGNAYIEPQSPTDLRVIDWRNITPPRPGRMFYEERKVMTGALVRWELGQLIHLRYKRAPDGINGVGPLAGSALADMSTDINAQQYTDTMLRNLGVAGIIGTPDFSAGVTQLIDPYAADDMREKLDEQFSGENRGKSLFFRSPMKFFEAKGAMGRVDMRALRWIPEERMLGPLGVAPALVHIGTGVEQSAVGATMDNTERRFLTNTVRPLADKIAQQLTHQLMGLYADPKRYFYEVDMSHLVGLASLEKEVQDQAMQTAIAGYEAGITGLVESRKIAGITDPVPDDIKKEEPEEDSTFAE